MYINEPMHINFINVLFSLHFLYIVVEFCGAMLPVFADGIQIWWKYFQYWFKKGYNILYKNCAFIESVKIRIYTGMEFEQNEFSTKFELQVRMLVKWVPMCKWLLAVLWNPYRCYLCLASCVVYSIKCAHDFVVFCFVVIESVLVDSSDILSISFRIISLSLGQSYDCTDCPRASEATLKDMGIIKSNLYKAQPECTPICKNWILCL